MPDPVERLDRLRQAQLDVKAAIYLQFDDLSDRFGVQIREVDRAMASIDDTLSDLIYDVMVDTSRGGCISTSMRPKRWRKNAPVVVGLSTACIQFVSSRPATKCLRGRSRGRVLNASEPNPRRKLRLCGSLLPLGAKRRCRT